MVIDKFLMLHRTRLTDYVLQQGRGRATYTNLINHLIEYRGQNTLVKDVNKDYLYGFVLYLKTARRKYTRYISHDKEKTLSPGTQLTYFNLLRSVLNAAVRDDLLVSNPAKKLSCSQKPKATDPDRCFLTFDEVKALIDNPLPKKRQNIICKAFLFCCFCGLRFSDVSSITWSQVQHLQDGSCQLELIQKKTKSRLYLPLSKNALSFMPDKGCSSENERVFDLPPYWDVNKVLFKWAEKAGMKKHITFHVSRHTFATMALYYGADLYTVSKLLGHSSINTTQIYAKVVDESKRNAVNLIPKIF